MNKILIILLPLFNQLREFIGPDRGLNTALDFRESFLANFNRCESELGDNIKYALMAFADECVMHSAWPGKITWMKRSLQLQFFGEHTAGEGFFERLHQLRQSGIVQIDQLEIYSLCLQLGFQGIYKFKDKTQKMDLLTSLEAQITALRKPSDFILSPEMTEQPIEKKSKIISLKWIGLGSLVIIIVMLVAYTLVAHLQLRHAIKILSTELTLT